MRQPRHFQVNIGGTQLAVNEWPGSGHPVLMLHATGFHSRCWDQVIAHLEGRHVFAADLRFHGASGDEGVVDWGVMCEDILHLVEHLDLADVVGVGHSIGGHAITRVAAWAPQRFRHLVLVDPVIMSPQRFQATLAMRGGHEPTDLPVSRRKNRWLSTDEMFERFEAREPFCTWDPAVLRDYCDHALREADSEDEWQLACDPLHEASIYLNQAGGEGIYIELPDMHTPVTLLRAPPSDNELPDMMSSPTWPELAAVLPDCEEVFLPGMNHFIPMQDPALVARHIKAAR